MERLPQLFNKQAEYFNKSTEDLSTQQIRDKLSQLASDVLPPHAVERFSTMLSINGSPNGYSAVTEELKYTSKFFSSFFLDLSELLIDYCHSQICSAKWNPRVTIGPLGWIVHH
jgi:hypothetical protein